MAAQEDKNGTLSYEEFTNLLSTVAQWKKMYFKFDRDRSGTLEKSEVASAIGSLGESGGEGGGGRWERERGGREGGRGEGGIGGRSWAAITAMAVPKPI